MTNSEFLTLFQCNPSQHTLYFPSSNSYTSKKSKVESCDLERHVQGEAILVFDPVFEGLCSWTCVDIDGANHQGLAEPEWHSLRMKAMELDAYCFRTKRLGAHVFVFFNSPIDSLKAFSYAKSLAKALGYPDAETFPIQSRQYKAVALPKISEMPQVVCKVDGSKVEATALEAEVKVEYVGDSEPGYWTPKDLYQNLTAWKKIRGFDFKRIGSKYAVPCPGNQNGWPDGARHSEKDSRMLSLTSTVFLKNGLPCFHCFHAHCNELGKKTWKDYQNYWDKDRLVFCYQDWCEEQVVKMQGGEICL